MEDRYDYVVWKFIQKTVKIQLRTKEMFYYKLEKFLVRMTPQYPKTSEFK